jgi:hypothetical protein
VIGFRRLALHDVDFEGLDRRPDRTIFQTREWLEFLVSSQDAEPVVAEVTEDGAPIGYFTGAIVRRFGLKILGSPLRGWTTSYMGFNLDEPERLGAAIEALPTFAFRQLGCIHLEVMDRSCSPDSAPSGFQAGRLAGYELDLGGDDDSLLARMTSHGRRDVRRSLRNGITVEEVDPTADTSFVPEYYEQVCQSFGKRSLTPTYPIERVELMVRHLFPTGRLLLLRARVADGTPAATGIFPGLPGSTAVFWMGASHRPLQSQLPNEALMWHALRTWRDRGAVRFDFGGGGRYKAKYGGDEIRVPWLRRSRFGVLEHGRAAALQLARRRQRLTEDAGS